MHWFGESWGSGINTMCPQVEVPKEPCHWCGGDFKDTDSGVLMPVNSDTGDTVVLALHKDCFDSKCSAAQQIVIASGVAAGKTRHGRIVNKRHIGKNNTKHTRGGDLTCDEFLGRFIDAAPRQTRRKMHKPLD